MAAISAMGHRSICHTPIGDTAMTVRRLWSDPWQSLRRVIESIPLKKT
ncbi:MAG: hypothetical protein IJR07_04430 [Bacteroidaceae bacterium]|nr:hypothetical protein [Bacteroidaceae bacterium]